MKRDIAVVLPVFNGAEMLRDCIASVDAAGTRIAEIIVVDDGSTDGTLATTRKLGETDSRIKVVHTENRGSYMARRTGIQACSADYIAFIDVDDRFIPESLDLLADLLEKTDSDVAVGGYLEVDSLDLPVDLKHTDSCSVFTTKEFWLRLMKWKTQEFQWYLVNKLYKRSLLENSIKADGLCQGDDVLQATQVFLRARKIVETENVVYLYYQNPESIMHKGFGDKDLDLIRVWDTVVEMTKNETVPLVDRRSLHDLALFNRWRTDYTLITRLILANDKKLDQKYAKELKRWKDGLKSHWKDLVLPHAMPKNREMLVIGLRFFYGPVKTLLRLGKRFKEGAGMKILEIIVEQIGYGGEEAFVMNLIQNIGVTGIDCLTPYPSLNERHSEIVEAHGGHLYSLELPIIPGKRKITVAREVGKFLRSHHYDIVHIHSLSDTMMALISTEAGKAGASKVIVHSHCGGQADGIKHKALVLLSSLVMERHVTIYCACSRLAADWKFTPKHAESAIILNNGIDEERYLFDEEKRRQVRMSLGYTEDTFVVGHVGRFTYQKNHPFLIEVFTEIAKRDGNVQLLLVGDGEDIERIRQLVKSHGLKEKVTFTGSVTNVEDYLQAMDVFVLPSRFEGLPIVGIEAQTSGLPVITADTVSREVDLTGEVQFLPLESPALWAENILNAKGRNRRRREGFLKEHGYSAKQTASRVRELYGIGI